MKKPEVLDIVSDADKIVGKASYQKVHTEKLMHRVAFALLFNDSGELLLQLRAKNKSAYPSMWSFSIGGHVRHGESYAAAIVREAKEEVGASLLAKEFSLRGKGQLREQIGTPVNYSLYEVHYNGPIEETTEEVDGVQFVDFPTLKHMIHTEPAKFHPQMIDILQKYWAKELA